MTETTIQNAAPTKIVSARLPIPEYIKFLTAATDAKMSVSEYFYYKIYQDDKVSELAKALSEAENRAKELNESLSEARELIIGWKKAAEKRAENEKKLQSDITSLQNKINALNEAQKQFKGEINTDQTTIAQLRKSNAELMKDIKDWESAYNRLKAIADNAKKVVLTYEKENTLFGSDELKKAVQGL